MLSAGMTGGIPDPSNPAPPAVPALVTPTARECAAEAAGQLRRAVAAAGDDIATAGIHLAAATEWRELADLLGRNRAFDPPKPNQ